MCIECYCKRRINVEDVIKDRVASNVPTSAGGKGAAMSFGEFRECLEALRGVLRQLQMPAPVPCSEQVA